MIKSKSELIFTVIAPNYGPQAMILGESIAKHMPDAVFRIVVLQDCPDISYIQNGINSYLSSIETKIDHRAVNFQDFDWSDFDVANCVNQYDLLEFATSVKPTILKNYLNDGYKRVTYLDPDIQVFSDFKELFDSKKSIAVTPHMLEDFPMDSRLPNQQSILHAGIYNLGFISVTSGAMPFLAWWEKKLNKYCSMDVEAGYHVDQRWVDWATNFVDVDVVRDPGLNVAYWNLHERTLKDGMVLQLNVTATEIYPLRFFHFSGFIGPSLDKISRHCTRKFDETEDLNNFLSRYHERRAFWKKNLGPIVWSLGGRLAGSSLPESWRKDLLAQNRKIKSQTFERDNNFEFTHNYFCSCITCESSFAGNSINTFFNQLSKNVITSIDFENQKTLFKELHKIGYQASMDLKGSMRTALPTNLCLIGYFGAPTGVGQMARNTLRLLEDSGISVNIHIIQTGFDDEDMLNSYLLKSQMNGRETTVIGFVNADMWIEHLVKPRLINIENQIVAAVWAWEIEDFPEYFRESAKYASKIYAISQFSATALGNFLKNEIEVFPTFGNIPLLNQQFDKLATPKKKYILARFDAKSVIERKNPNGVLEVWDVVKSQLPGHELVIKTIDFVKNSPPELLNRIRNSERVVLIDEVYSEEQNRRLLSDASAYISLHRAEGLGLNILEALAADIPTVTTNYSGLSAEIEQFVFPVDFKFIEIGNKAAPYPANGFWADPSIVSAGQQLIKAVKLMESGDWELDKKSRLGSLKTYLQKAELSTLANCAQLLSTSKGPVFAKSSIPRKLNIKNSRFFLKYYRHLPFPVRKIVRRIFLRYFNY
jgi:glycosyltransferase involved in cell wall biosynthesis